ncbi:MAG: hypothetical protein NTY00_13250 [Deltaproteobacteria bacterium]|nr:hypothetical protein [Deltaproteobacteria bacterium]
MFAVSFLKMKNVVVLATLVFMFLGMEVLLLSVVSVTEARSTTVPVTQIFHQQVSSFLEGSSLPIEVVVKDPAGVTGVRCYFRFDSSSPFVYSEMAGARNNVFTTKLPVAIATVQKIEYLFLVVNGQKQAIISPTFTVNKKSGNVQSTEVQNLVPEQYQLKSEITAAATVKSFFLQPDNVQISLVPQQDHYGVLAGLYSREQIGTEVAAGYFGSFRLDPQRGMMAVKGYIVLRHSSDLSLSQEKSTVAKATVVEAPAPVEPVFAPNITGDDWTGYFWRSDYFAGTEVPVTATVTQTADGLVSITTSKEGLGHYFEGNIDITGHMLVSDAYDNEVWSTLDGPATDVYIKIEDYVVVPDLEHPAPPLNIIKLTRKRPKLPLAAISLLLKK